MEYLSMKKKTLVITVIVTLLLLIIGLFGLRTWIYSDAIQAAEEAQARFSGDRVEALIAQLKSDEMPMRQKNRSVWALGQLRDKRAVPSLERLVTNEQCDHVNFICQSEVKKALGHCRGETYGLFFWK